MNNSSHLTLSQLNGIIQSKLNEAFFMQQFWIVADITEHSFKQKTDYHYFEFVEKDVTTNLIVAKIKGAAWGNASQRIKDFEASTGQKFTNNIHVLAKVSINFHKVFGLSLELIEIDPSFTLGVIETKRQETLLRLVTNYPTIIQKRGDHYSTYNSSLELPPVISRLAVISSQTSAGNEDFKHTLINNPYGYHFEIDDYFTVVQNEVNAGIFLERLLDVFRSGKKYDAVIINRGGGAQTDFLIFDNFKIGLAVAKFPIPVITGIGHQKNQTITDLMAHTSTKTPTKAAEFIVTHNKMFEDRLLSFQQTIIIKSQSFLAHQNFTFNKINSRIVNSSRTSLEKSKLQLITLKQNLTTSCLNEISEARREISSKRFVIASLPKTTINNEKRGLSRILPRILSASNHIISKEKLALKSAVSLINVISPENILKKGFAIVKSNGEITSDPNKFTPGAEIEVILRLQSIKATVNTKKDYHGNDFNLPTGI
ncbi:exodeoxyribonuclease VII large subunit (plasmid) [Chryseobacterium sp. SNU WT5]|uniref:exodeoxyribonuclease VII large subunit n=1 Tax=Chryseobacterium sp. SNU WT5 TaxID=2594269 RepID=UPI00117C5EAC|nr:exodeoxyribonuclease VII large subunit [Chryseobacterium sp. SNU WT5]QDP86743.1 exodeoxyribonuclease VII large subunit [Chryseobacterium sp. SNU WT5]